MAADLTSYSGKKVIVTGASGFIGPHLCNKLAELGATIYAVSRNPKELFNSASIILVRSDFSKPEDVEQRIDEINPDYIFHLAGLASGGRGIALIDPTLQSNFMTTLNVLQSATKLEHCRMILAGSMEEPGNEEAEITPSSPYAASKLAASAYARMFHKLYNTNVVIARLFMTYGPGKQPEKKLLPYVISRFFEDRSPQLGSGNRLIDWVYIDDVIDGLLAIGIAENIAGDTIDIGTGKLTTTTDFVGSIQKVIGTKSKASVAKLADRKMEQEKKADVDTTLAKTGWQPQIDILTGLTKTIDWYRQHHKPAIR